MTRGAKAGLYALVLAAAVIVAFLVGCVMPPDQPDVPSIHPLPCATWQAPDGTWMEEDNEEVDGDPCDRLPDAKKKSPSVKPNSATKAPAKPSPARTTRK